MSQSLCFNDFTFSPVTRDNQPWFRSSEIARALDYKREDILGKLYRKNADEFTSDMTQVVENLDNTESVLSVKVRLFSLRGCYALAMFARTPVAKAFRKWCLDVIERYGDRVPVAHPVELDASRPSRRTDPERKALTAIINTWVGMAPIHYASARAQVNAHFGVASVDSLTIGQVRDAIRWVQEKIDALQQALPAQTQPASLPASIDEKPFLEFIKDIQSAHEEVSRILSNLHHSVFTLSWKVAEALEQRADIRLYLVPDMLSENTLRGYLHQSVYNDVKKALTAPGRQLEEYSNPGYSLLGIVRQLNTR